MTKAPKPEPVAEQDRRRAAFQRWLDSGEAPAGTDRIVLDIAFTAGWRAKRTQRPWS